MCSPVGENTQVMKPNNKAIPPQVFTALVIASVCLSQSSCSLPNPFEPQAPVGGDLETVLGSMAAAKSGIFPLNEPDASGALGRNKRDGQYSTVRWQLDLLPLVAHGVIHRDALVLEKGVLAIEYGQAHQTAGGGFAYEPMPGVTKGPTAADLASGAAFYLASVGSALYLMDHSPWFRTNGVCGALRGRLDNLNPSFSLALTYLISNEALLTAADIDAPNRLFFDAVAAQGLSAHGNNPSGQALALRFAEKALGLLHPEGWFREGSGFDSSYQAVGALNLFYFSMMLPESQRRPHQDGFYRAAAWEASRVTPWGEVSVVGNSRVYPGGESFLGAEKEVAALSVAQCLFAAGALYGDRRFDRVGNDVTRFYFKR